MKNEEKDQKKSESANDEGKSEEFKNFERALKGILAIPPDEAKKIAEKIQYPKDGDKLTDAS